MKEKYSNTIKCIFSAFFIFAAIISCGCIQSETGAGGEDANYGDTFGPEQGPPPGEEFGPGPAAGPSFKQGYYDNNITGFISEKLSEYPVGELTVEEASNILYIAEREKLGRDLSLMYFDIWGMRTFLNAAGSNQADTDSMKILIDRYNLENPVRDERGMFTDTGLQELYSEMVSSGSATATDAINNSVQTEEIQIALLEAAISSTDKPDLVFVYENLLRGSENNLRTFTGNTGNFTPYLGPGPEIPPEYETDKEMTEN